MSEQRQHDIEMRGLRHQFEEELSKLVADRDKWHRVAMEAGAITCVGGRNIFPLKAELSSLRAQLVEWQDDYAALKKRNAELEGRSASARKALEVVRSMIHGEALEHAVVDTSTMMTLGQIVEAAVTDEKST